MDNLKSRSIKAVAWDFFGKMARHGTSFIVTVFLARLLDPSDFGVIAIVMVFVMVAMVFTDVGLGQALIQRRHVLPIHYSSVFYINICIAGVLTVITFFSAPWISDFYNNDKLVAITEVMSALFVINAFSTVQRTILRKELKYSSLAGSDVSAAVLSGIMGISLAYYGGGVWSLVAQQLSRGVLFNIFIWRASRWTPSLIFSLKALRQLWGFGFRMFLAALLETIFSKLDVIIIGKLFTPATLGFFDQAKRLNMLIISYSSGSIMGVMFPVLSKIQNDLPRFQSTAIKTLGIISFVVFFLLGFLYLISEELIVFLFTEKWLISADYFKVLLFSGFAYPVSALLVNILSSRGNSKDFLRLEIYKKIIQSINLIVAFSWGIFGYLYGMLIVSILAVSLNMWYASREISVSFFVLAKPVLIQMLISIISTLLVIVTTEMIEVAHTILILIKIFIFILIYFLLSRILNDDLYHNIISEGIVIMRKLNKGL